MKRNISILMLAGASLLASCSKEEMMNDKESGLQPVTLSVSLDKGMQTRATDTNKEGDEKVTRCLVQILDNDGNPIDGYAEAKEMEGSETGGFTRTVVLNDEKIYTLLFWADRGEEHYTAKNLKEVTQADSDASPDIAYAAKGTWEGTDGPVFSVELHHVVCKITVRSTVDANLGGALTVTVPETYSSYNVLTQTVGDSPAELSREMALPDKVVKGEKACHFYALVSSESQNLTVAYRVKSIEVENVPTAPNKHIILSGNIGAIGGDVTVTLEAKIEPSWITPDVEVTWDVEVGDYLYADGTWSKNYEDKPENKCVGIVFYVNEDRAGGKIVSLDEVTVEQWGFPSAGVGGESKMGSKDNGKINTEWLERNEEVKKFDAINWCVNKKDGGFDWYLPAPLELQDLYAASCGIKLVEADPGEGEVKRWDVIDSDEGMSEYGKYATERKKFSGRIEEASGVALSGEYLSSYPVETGLSSDGVRSVACGKDGNGAGSIVKKSIQGKVRAVAVFPKAEE